MTIRVLIADDHTLFRRGLASLLAEEKGIEVVGEAADGPKAVRLAEAIQPDVILLDVHMPAGPGIEALPVLRRAAPDAKVIMVTVSDRDEDLLAAVRDGAHGYLLKNSEPGEVVLAIHRAQEGQASLSPEAATRLLEEMRGHGEARSGAAEPLTERESEVLGLIAAGRTNPEIAGTLHLSVNTVKTHVRTLFRKLGVRNRTQAAARAREIGITSPLARPG